MGACLQNKRVTDLMPLKQVKKQRATSIERRGQRVSRLSSARHCAQRCDGGSVREWRSGVGLDAASAPPNEQALAHAVGTYVEVNTV